MTDFDVPQLDKTVMSFTPDMLASVISVVDPSIELSISCEYVTIKNVIWTKVMCVVNRHVRFPFWTLIVQHVYHMSTRG